LGEQLAVDAVNRKFPTGPVLFHRSCIKHQAPIRSNPVTDLVCIFGPPASGKAAVGHELAEMTGFRFFYNHLTAEPVAAMFGWGTHAYRQAIEEVRHWFFRKVLALENSPSVIFTFVWFLDDPTDNRAMSELVALFETHGQKVFFVELCASMEARLAREGSPFRMALKPSKRNVEQARRTLVEYEAKATMNSSGHFPYPQRHLVLNTEKQDAAESARQICRHFDFTQHG